MAASAVHRPPAVKLIAGCFTLDDRFVLTTSSDMLLRRWQAPQRGVGDELFLSHYLRLRKQQPSRPPLLFTTRRAFVLRVPLLLPLPFPARHTGEVPVLRVHPLVPSLVLTAAHDGRVCFWDAEQRCLLRCIRQPSSHWIDGSFSPAGDSVALTSEEGRLALLGLHSRLLSALTPSEQFFFTDYHPITRDDSGYVVDTSSQTPPHLHPARHVLIHADGSVYEPQPRIDTAPDRSMPAPQPQTLRTEAQPAVSADAIMAADLMRASRLAELRVERRLRWQSRHLSHDDAETVQAAAYRRRRECVREESSDQAEQAASLQLTWPGQQQQQQKSGREAGGGSGGEPGCSDEEDGCGWWQERRGPDGHWTVDVEDDVAEQTLDGDGDGWTEEDAAQQPHQQAVSTFPPVAASAGHRAADDGGDGSASVAEWLRAQRALEAEMQAEAEREQREEADDDWTAVSRSSSGRVAEATVFSSPPVQEAEAVDSSRAGRAERRAATRQRFMSNATVWTEMTEEKGQAPVSVTEPTIVEDDEDTSLLVRARRGREGRPPSVRRRGRGGSSSASVSAARRRVVQYYRDDDDDWDVDEDEVQDDDDRDGQEWQEDDEQRAEADEDEDEEDGEEDQDDSEARSPAAMSHSQRRAARGLRPMPVRSVRLRQRVETPAPTIRHSTRVISRAGSGLSTNSNSSSISSNEARAARAKRRRGEADVSLLEEQTETEAEPAALWSEWKQEDGLCNDDGVHYTLVAAEGVERSEADTDAALVIKLRRSLRGDREREWEQGRQQPQPLRRRGVVRFKLAGQEVASLSLKLAAEHESNSDQSSSSSSSSKAAAEAAAPAVVVMETDEQTQPMLIS